MKDLASRNNLLFLFARVFLREGEGGLLVKHIEHVPLKQTCCHRPVFHKSRVPLETIPSPVLGLSLFKLAFHIHDDF